MTAIYLCVSIYLLYYKYKRGTVMKNNPKVELMRKIINAKLTKDELSAVFKKTQEILAKRV